MLHVVDTLPVAREKLYEADVVAVLDLQVGGVGAAERVQVQTRREAEFIDERPHSLPEVARRDHAALFGREQGVDRMAVPGQSAPAPVGECLRSPVEHRQHGPLLGRCAAHRFAVPDTYQTPFAEQRCPSVAGEIDQLQVADFVAA